MSLTEKEKQSIKFIKNIPKENTQIAFSGGKDSIVVYYLCKQAGVDFPVIYGNTTIDPVGTKKLIRNYYPDVQILNPEKSFFQLVSEKGLPTRVGRFCCEHLKERYGIGKNNIEGIRWEESNSRKKYEPEQCDTRKWMKGAKHYYPIINFTAKDVWTVINENGLKTLPYYHPPYNWKRHGCVGCPLASPKQQITEYKVFPKYAHALIKAIRKNIEAGKSLSKISDNSYEVFWWWISRMPIKVWKTNKEVELFKADYQEQFHKLFH